MTDWIEWNGGECPIKSAKTRYTLKFRTKAEYSCRGSDSWDWHHYSKGEDIIAYRITEDHEPKMTREQITAQIEALQKQLDAIPDETRGRFWIGVTWSDDKYSSARTHEEMVTIINGVPHIHGVAMKEVTK